MMFPNAAQLISNLKKNFADESEVRAAFNSWDTNKDGQISFAELKSAVQRSGQRLTDDDINAIFVVGDKDQKKCEYLSKITKGIKFSDAISSWNWVISTDWSINC